MQPEVPQKTTPGEPLDSELECDADGIAWVRAAGRGALTVDVLEGKLAEAKALYMGRDAIGSIVEATPSGILNPALEMGGAVTGDWHRADTNIKVHLRIQQWGEELYACLRQNLIGSQLQAMLRNLEDFGPARGYEAWFRVVRDCRGANGPRLLKLAVRLFNPHRLKMAELADGLEQWEADLREFEFPGQVIGDVLQIFGLTQLVPLELQKDLVRVNHTLSTYKECRRWCLDQCALRRDDGKANCDAHQVAWGGERTEEDQNEQQSAEQQQYTPQGELLWFGNKGGGKKGGHKGGKASINGHCNHCGAFGHPKRLCPILDAEMAAWRAKGGGKARNELGQWKSNASHGTSGKKGGKGMPGSNPYQGKGYQSNGWQSYGKGSWGWQGGKASNAAGKGYGGYSYPSAPSGIAWNLAEVMERLDGEQDATPDPWASYSAVPAYSVGVTQISKQFNGLKENMEEEDEENEEDEEKERTEERELANSIFLDEGMLERLNGIDGMVEQTLPKQQYPEEIEQMAEWIEGSGKKSRRRMPRVCRRQWKTAPVPAEAIYIKSEATNAGRGSELMPLEFKRDGRDGWTRVAAVPDTGAAMSVAPGSMAPTYEVTSSVGSRCGQEFTTASNHNLPNEGEQHLPMLSPEGVWTKPRWQIAAVTRPLLSVGEECDSGRVVMFGKRGGYVLNTVTKEMQWFPRKQGGYEMEMWLPPAEEVNAARSTGRSSVFARQGES